MSEVPPPPATGVPAVDEVLGAVAGLPERPLPEHGGVYEEAHNALRRVLDEPPTTA